MKRWILLICLLGCCGEEVVTEPPQAALAGLKDPQSVAEFPVNPTDVVVIKRQAMVDIANWLAEHPDDPQAEEYLTAILGEGEDSSWRVRRRVLLCLYEAGLLEEYRDYIARYVDDEHPKVREAAISLLSEKSCCE
jgi:DNA-binding transcriptional ArsR family regulator